MTTWTDAERATWTHRVTLDEMRGAWEGSDVVVVACGPSAHDVELRGLYQSRWTIGCNRSVEFCSPDFAACFEPRKDREVWGVVKDVPAISWILSHIPRDHPRVILTPDKPSIRREVRAPPAYGQSPFYAIYCALALGFETIGVVGLDLSSHRYRSTNISHVAYRGLRAQARHLGAQIVMLAESRLKVFPKGSWADIRPKSYGSTSARTRSSS